VLCGEVECREVALGPGDGDGALHGRDGEGGKSRAREAGHPAGDPTIADRTWVQLTETYDGGWGLAGHANTNAELVALARAALTGS
jgi:hypothetical protein